MKSSQGPNPVFFLAVLQDSLFMGNLQNVTTVNNGN